MNPLNRLVGGGRLPSFLPPASSLSTIAALLIFSQASAGHSATNTVTSLADSGAGSLRQVIADSAGGDSIIFNVAGTIQLTNGELAVSKNLNLIGPGFSAVTVSANKASRVFKINPSATVTISGLTIRDGRSAEGAANNPGDPGGGIYNAGTLFLDHCVVVGNATGQGGSSGGSGGPGGGIYNIGTLDLNWCVISTNQTGNGMLSGSGGSGGGIYNEGNFTASTCLFANNSTGYGGSGANAYYYGGNGGSGGLGAGIFAAGTAILSNCNIVSNTCGSGGFGGYAQLMAGSGGSGGGGAGICGGNLIMTGCTIVGNTGGSGGTGGPSNGFPGGGGSGGNGGGIYCGSLFFMTNCTVTANMCGSGGDNGAMIFGPPSMTGGYGGNGGGLFSSATNQAIIACTIASNAVGIGGGPARQYAVDGKGGGIYSETIPGPGLLNTIVALNTGPVPDVSGAVHSLGNNWIGITNGGSGFISLSDHLGSFENPADPRLAPLADNGGPTPTMALLPGSPAIDAASAVGGPAIDQRGISRPQGFGADIGAFEFVFNVPQIRAGKLRPDSSFWLQSCGLPNQSYTLQTTTNLLNWSDLAEVCTASNGTCEVTHSNLPVSGQRFYRLKQSAP